MSYIDTDFITRYTSVNKYSEDYYNKVKEAFINYMDQGRRNGKTNGDYYRHLPPIKKVIFNNPATIVFWDDGTKTVVKKSDKDEWDPEKGLAMAIVKKLFARNQFLKMIPKEAWADVVERKVGKWVKNKRDGGWHCSCCGETDVYAFAYDDAETHLFLHDLYCPCCGARMKGEDNALEH